MVFSAHYLIYIMFAVTAVCIGYLTIKKQWREVMLFSLTLVVSFTILSIASKLFISDRPFVDSTVTQLIAHAANQSFPSDHTAGSMTIALALLAFTRFKKIGWVFVLIASLIGFSRIFAGVHYPFDILGGIATALLGTLIVYGIAQLVRSRHLADFSPEQDSDIKL